MQTIRWVQTRYCGFEIDYIELGFTLLSNENSASGANKVMKHRSVTNSQSDGNIARQI